MSDTKSLGQYFTPSYISDFMVSLSNKSFDVNVLEPSAGEGVFLSSLSQKGFKNISAYEIDTTLNNHSSIKIKYESFIKQDVNNFDLIIGNPPYIRWKNIPEEMKLELSNNSLWKIHFNSLCDYLYIFILKSIEALNENGELIFITPEYWMHTTHSLSLRNYMIENGYFEKIIHFKETPIFDKVASSIIIFKYVKNSQQVKPKISYIEYDSRQKLSYELLSQIKKLEPIQDCKYIELEHFSKNTKWLFAETDVLNMINNFEKSCFVKKINNDLFDNSSSILRLGDIARIGNGMVSGLDKAFQLPEDIGLNDLEKLSTITVAKAKHLTPYNIMDTVKYIFFTKKITEQTLINEYPNFYKHLFPFIENLNKRYKYNREIDYWEWVFLRNYTNLFNIKKQKIFIPCKERISHKDFIRFALANEDTFPTQDVTAIYINNDIKESIYYFISLLNNKRIFEWLKYNGIIKGNILEFSEKPTSQIPIKLIDWNNPCEVKSHNKITELSKMYLENEKQSLLEQIDIEIDNLFNC